MTTAAPFTTKVSREDAVNLLRTPGAYCVGELAMTYYAWIKRPGKPDVKVSKAVVGWVRDHYPGWYDESTKPWKWYLAPEAVP